MLQALAVISSVNITLDNSKHLRQSLVLYLQLNGKKSRVICYIPLPVMIALSISFKIIPSSLLDTELKHISFCLATVSSRYIHLPVVTPWAYSHGLVVLHSTHSIPPCFVSCTFMIPVLFFILFKRKHKEIWVCSFSFRRIVLAVSQCF